MAKDWVSFTEILEIVPYSRASIKRLIKEKALKYAYHYIDKRLPGRKRPTYGFSVLRMKEYLAEKPNERLIGSGESLKA